MLIFTYRMMSLCMYATIVPQTLNMCITMQPFSIDTTVSVIRFPKKWLETAVVGFLYRSELLLHCPSNNFTAPKPEHIKNTKLIIHYTYIMIARNHYCCCCSCCNYYYYNDFLML